MKAHELSTSTNSIQQVQVKVAEVMSYFAEATDILQTEGKLTSNRVIPVVDSLENALIKTRLVLVLCVNVCLIV